MDLSTLKAQIKTGNLDSFYVFTGTEGRIMQIYIDQMAKSGNYVVKKLGSITELAQKLHKSSFVRNAEICVFRDCKELITNEKLSAPVLNVNKHKSTIFIFIYTTLDKRTKFYKSCVDHIVEFNPLSTEVLRKYVRKDIALADKNAVQLIEICENDYGRIGVEIDKIKTYSEATGKDVNKAFTDLLLDKTIYIPPRDAVFDFVDEVLKGHPSKAFELLQESYDSGEATLVLISNLYNSAKQVLQVQSYQGNDLANATGLTPFQIKLAKPRCGVYRNSDLIELMRLARDVEKGIKVGEIEDRIAVQYILSRFWC